MYMYILCMLYPLVTSKCSASPRCCPMARVHPDGQQPAREEMLGCNDHAMVPSIEYVHAYVCVSVN